MMSENESSRLDDEDEIQEGLLELIVEGDTDELKRFLVESNLPPPTEGRPWDQLALLLAAEMGDEEMVCFLVLDLKVEATCTPFIRTPLAAAIEEGHEDVAVFLIHEGKADLLYEIDEEDCTPLMKASFFGLMDVVRALTSVSGCNLGWRDQDGMDAIAWAAKGDRVEVMSFLVDKMGGSNVIAVSYLNGDFLWHLAAAQGSNDVLKWLIRKIDPDLMLAGQEGLAPHHLAAQNGRLSTLKWLIMEAGSPVEGSSRDGKSAMHYAAMKGHLHVVRWLVEEAWADLKALDFDLKTPEDLAAAQNHQEVISCLQMVGKRSLQHKQKNRKDGKAAEKVR